MRFMNTWEVDEMVQRFDHHPILGKGARTLANLRDAADQNSDGWAYWPKPARAARKLMELLETHRRAYFMLENPEVDASQMRAALAPIKAFRTRSGLSFEVEEV